ncbi:MAG TPA: DPP IV N-terminal domain-containing protein [Gemmatimonadaceae bacterium]|jgi:Tol biopolymer transport system component
MKAVRTAPAILFAISLISCEGRRPSEPGAIVDQSSAPAFSREVGRTEESAAIVVFHSARGGNPRIYTMTPGGRDQDPLTGTNTANVGNDLWPDISPNGRLVAFTSNRSGNNEIYVFDRRTGTLTNVSNSPADDNWPRWSPNGERIAFHSNRDGNYNIFTVKADGSDLHRVTNSAVLDQWPDWSPDGKRIVFRRGNNLSVADANGEEQNVQQLTFTPATSSAINQMASWSPNGRRIVFMSTRDGYPSVFLMSARGETVDRPAANLTPKATDQASQWLSRAPSWSSAGGRIYFMSFRPSTNGDVELFVVNPDGKDLTRLTESAGEDGGPRMPHRPRDRGVDHARGDSDDDRRE